MIQPARKPRISTSQDTNSASPVVMRLPPRAATWTPTDRRFHAVLIRHERQENSMLYRNLRSTANSRRRLRRVLRTGRMKQRQGDGESGDNGDNTLIPVHSAVPVVTQDMIHQKRVVGKRLFTTRIMTRIHSLAHFLRVLRIVWSRGTIDHGVLSLTQRAATFDGNRPLWTSSNALYTSSRPTYFCGASDSGSGRTT